MSGLFSADLEVENCIGGNKAWEHIFLHMSFSIISKVLVGSVVWLLWVW